MDGAEFLDDLQRWVADAAADHAGSSRRRARALAAQAAEDATFAGVLLDLSERHADVAVLTAAGNLHTGRVVAVGEDFVAVWARRGVAVFVSTAAIAWVRGEPGTRAVTGDRPPALRSTMLAVLAGAAADRPRVHVVTAGGATISGELRTVGADVLVVRADGEPPTPTYVPAAGTTEVTLLDLR